nr:LysR family transcriptional regulator [Pseudomonas aeruginosa]
VKIFEFTRPTICLTSDGEKILRYALQRENIEQELWHDLKNDLNIIAGSISIGSSYTYGEQYLSEKLIKVANEYPDLHVNAYLMNSDTVIDNVKHNIVD